jgi:hypothetical protein
MCVHAGSISFLDRAELIDGMTALIAAAKSPELREFQVFELKGSELPWKDLGIAVGKGQEVTFLLGGRVAWHSCGEAGLRPG